MQMFRPLAILSVLLGVVVSSVSLPGEDACNAQETKPCTCSTNDKTLSLANLMARRDGKPFSVKGGQYTYYISPCDTPLNVPACSSVNPQWVTCQVDEKSGSAYGLGVQGKQTVIGYLENFVLVNQFTDTSQVPQIQRIMRLHMVCADKDAELVFVSASELPSPLSYEFKLETRDACLTQPSHSSGGLSAGSVMVILFFVAVIVYLVGGTLFLKYVKHAEGRESIPNYEFWSGFPSLVKDGVLFTFRGCKAESTYEKI